MVHEKVKISEESKIRPERPSGTRRLNSIPVLHVRGTHFEVGYSIGRMFKAMIQDMLKSWHFFNSVLWKKYLSETGKETYEASLGICQQRYPNYVNEVRGMAEGSEVPFEKLFLLNIDSIMTASENEELHYGTGCTSIICNKNEVILGHTEDAMCEILNNVYIVAAEILDGDGKTMEKFTSFSYAGHLMGYTMGFNDHGMIHSVNTLFPTVHKTGTPRAFIARSILGAGSLGELLNILRDVGSGITDGFSLNVHFANSEGPKLFYNIEIAPPHPDADLESLLDVTAINPGEWYIHCNKYLRIKATQPATPIAVSTCRHDAIEKFHEPEGLSDIKALLSDQSDVNYPVFMCDDMCTKLSHVKTVAVGIFDVNQKTWSLYIGQPSATVPVAVLKMNY